MGRGSFGHKEEDICIAARGNGGLNHSPVQLGPAFVHPWRVEKNELTPFDIFDAEDSIPCGLRRWSDDSDLLPDDAVE
jgi:hypothetical protein